MTTLDNISNVAYKKGNWIRYALWGILVALIIATGSMFIEAFHNAQEIEATKDETTSNN